MSIRVDSSSLITGAVVVGVPGLGVLAESVPSTGEHGPGIASTWLGPAEAGKEVRVLITQWPEVGSLFVWEDTSFEYNGPGGTAYAQLYVDGQPVDTPQTVTVTVGAGATYNDSLSESATLADTAATTNILTALLAEAVTLLDASSNGSLYSEVLAASVALSDALTSTAALTGAVTESTALSDALASLVTFQATLTETVTTGDTVVTQADQTTLPRVALGARLSASVLAARVQATSLSARLQ